MRASSESLCGVLRNGHSLSRRPALRICPLTGSHPPHARRRPRQRTPACVRHPFGSANVFGQPLHRESGTRLGWRVHNFVRGAQLSARVQIPRIFDGPHAVSCCRGEDHEPNVYRRLVVVEKFVTNVVQHPDWFAEFEYVVPFGSLSASLLIACIEMLSVGASADSAYEYMLKQWLLSGRTDTKVRDMCMSMRFPPSWFSS